MKPIAGFTAGRQELLGIPDALRQTLLTGRPEFEALIRRTRWGEGAIYVVGSGAAAIAGLAGVYGFEGQLGRPVIARPAMEFRAYSMSIVQPRSVFLAVSCSGESDETLETALAARRKGATVLALTASATSRLAGMADGVFLIRCGQEEGSGIKCAVCQQAVLSYLGLLSARLLKRPDALVEDALDEFEKLPEHAEWVLTQLQDAIRVFASEIKTAQRLCPVGAGSYRVTALQLARSAKGLGLTDVEALEPNDLDQERLVAPDRKATVIIFSGSRCRLKKRMQNFVKLSQQSGLHLLCITDSDQRELVGAARLAVLLPVVSERVGSILALIAGACALYEATKASG
jgi:glutamine---fructose-6-phosphate transaminase (isomerizing)